jgi:thymidine phosphorylase
MEVSVDLAARMLLLGGIAADRADAEQRVRTAITSGAGLERFRQIVEFQGGDPHVVDDYDRLPHVAADQRHTVTAERAGFVTGVDAELVGRASVILGAGRDRVEDPVDFAVGIVVATAPGDEVRAGDPLLELHYRDRAKLEGALDLVRRAVVIGEARPAPRPLIVGEVR